MECSKPFTWKKELTASPGPAAVAAILQRIHEPASDQNTYPPCQEIRYELGGEPVRKAGKMTKGYQLHGTDRLIRHLTIYLSLEYVDEKLRQITF